MPIFDTEILIIIIINYYYHHINIIIIITITTIIIKNKREKGKENTISSMCIVELSLKRPIIYQKTPYHMFRGLNKYRSQSSIY